MQYTIEARELSNTHSRRPHNSESLRTVVVANDPDEAIHQYVRDREAELVSFTQPARGHESIGTMKKEDSVFLVRVYTA